MTSREVYEKREGFYEKARQNPKVWIGLGIILAVILLVWLPPWRVSHFEINNATVEADLENQYRATLAQVLGGSAVAVGIYFAWGNLKVAQATLESNQEKFQKNFKLAQEGQITEHFTRAVDQLGAYDKDGDPAIEIRLGGIYALERIANESDKDYWSIMEILTAYVRKNSSTEDQKVVEQNRVPVDIQAVLNVIGRRKGFFLYGEPKNLQLQLTNLRKAHLECIHLEEVNFHASDLQGAYLQEARLVHADLRAHLEYADLREAHLEYADIKEANLQGAKLKGTNLEGADLRGAKNITIDQLSKVKTLYNAKLDPELEKPLREKYPALFEKPDE